MKKFKLIFVAIIMIANYSLTAQVAVTTDGSSANASAMLEVKSANKGLLIPQIALTGVNDASTITTPATSLLIYNTATATGVTPGYYYNSGTIGSPVWERFTTGIIDGSETKVTAGTNVTVTGVGTTASPYVVGNPTLTIGQSYQGGIIFWLDATGQHGLIAATADQSTGIRWFGGTNTNTRARADGIGAGLKNTAIIIANQGPVDGNAFAATVCNEYSVTVGGVTYGDWYLPSKYELNLLYSQKTVVGGFASAFYWSSSEYDNGSAWHQFFAIGGQASYSKDYTGYVRAVRDFKQTIFSENLSVYTST